MKCSEGKSVKFSFSYVENTLYRLIGNVLRARFNSHLKCSFFFFFFYFCTFEKRDFTALLKKSSRGQRFRTSRIFEKIVFYTFTSKDSIYGRVGKKPRSLLLYYRIVRRQFRFNSEFVVFGGKLPVKFDTVPCSPLRRNGNCRHFKVFVRIHALIFSDVYFIEIRVFFFMFSSTFSIYLVIFYIVRLKIVKLEEISTRT